MGTTYEFEKIETVDQLKVTLEKIAADLPADGSLKVSEVHLHNGELGYTLSDGIPQ